MDSTPREKGMGYLGIGQLHRRRHGLHHCRTPRRQSDRACSRGGKASTTRRACGKTVLLHSVFWAEQNNPNEGTRKSQRGSDASPSAQPHHATPSFLSQLCLSFTPQPTP